MTTRSARFSQTPSEKKRYVLDYDAQLSLGEVVSLIVPAVTSPTNAPVSPAFVVDGIVIGPTGRQAIFYARGGVDTHTYEIQFIATTSIDQTIEDIVEFDVSEKL